MIIEVVVGVLAGLLLMALLAIVVLAWAVRDEKGSELARIQLETRRAERRLILLVHEGLQAMIDAANQRRPSDQNA